MTLQEQGVVDETCNETHDVVGMSLDRTMLFGINTVQWLGLLHATPAVVHVVCRTSTTLVIGWSLAGCGCSSRMQMAHLSTQKYPHVSGGCEAGSLFTSWGQHMHVAGGSCGGYPSNVT